MEDNLIWWVRDAADSICGQTGARAHQEKLHAAADELKNLTDSLALVRVTLNDLMGSI